MIVSLLMKKQIHFMSVTHLILPFNVSLSTKMILVWQISPFRFCLLNFAAMNKALQSSYLGEIPTLYKSNFKYPYYKYKDIYLKISIKPDNTCIDTSNICLRAYQINIILKRVMQVCYPLTISKYKHISFFAETCCFRSF